jgi:hypothetical protein
MANLNDLKNRIQAAISTADVDMLQCTWMELEYHLDMAMVLMLNVCNVQNKL